MSACESGRKWTRSCAQLLTRWCRTQPFLAVVGGWAIAAQVFFLCLVPPEGRRFLGAGLCAIGLYHALLHKRIGNTIFAHAKQAWLPGGKYWLQVGAADIGRLQLMVGLAFIAGGIALLALSVLHAMRSAVV